LSALQARLIKLCIALAAVALVWLVILPLTAEQRTIAHRLTWLEQQRVDPAAMYYTELDMMKPIFTRMALQRREKQPSSH